jgi:hypothetical protein
MDPVTEFIKLGSALFKKGATLVPKLAGSAFHLEEQLHPAPLNPDPKTCSGSTHILLYYIKMLVR